MRKYLYFAVFIGLTACTMNKLFLHPTKLDRAATHAQVVDYKSDQTLNVQLGTHFQPTFFDSLGNEFLLNYTIESIEFLNRTGKNINGWFMAPKSKTNNITIFYLHGNAGSIYYQYGLMVPFVEKGFTVFMIDYSGFGYSEGKAKIKNVYTDAEDAFQYMKTRKEYVGDKIIVYGQSLGGHLTAALSRSLQSEVDAFVMEGAFANHDEVAAQASGLGWFAKMMVRERYSGLDSIVHVSKPKLFIHSTEDKVVPFENSELLYNAAKNPKEFYSIEGRHVFGPLLFTDSIEQRMLRLLE